MATKQTREQAASHSSSVMRDKNAPAKHKSAAGSAMSQKGTTKKTTKETASKASSVLKDGSASKKQKSAAGSSLSQKHK